jgi:hypothetical protein
LSTQLWFAPYGDGIGPLHLLARAITLALEPPVAAVATPAPPMIRALRPFGWPAIGNSSQT